MEAERRAAGLLLGRYRLHDEIAAGGMATVHLGRLVGDAGFARTVAIKRLHPWQAKLPEVVTMFTDEARIAARIRHPNVVDTLDVVQQSGEVFLVMEYVHGAALSRLIQASSKRRQKIPPRIVAAVLSGALRGLHAAHEAKDAKGNLLGVVHRDVSPQNVLVGTDGVARVLDFGIARAAGRAHVTGDNTIKGKIAYMSPEQLRGDVLDRRSDVYAAGIVLWESLTCRRLYAGAADDLAVLRLLEADVEPPSKRAPDVPREFDDVALRALKRSVDERYPTALQMAEALEAALPMATPSEVAAWVEELAGDELAERARRIEAIEAIEDEARQMSALAVDPGEPFAPRVDRGSSRPDKPKPEDVTAMIGGKPAHVVEATVKMEAPLVASAVTNLSRTNPARTSSAGTRELPRRLIAGGIFAAVVGTIVLVLVSRSAPETKASVTAEGAATASEALLPMPIPTPVQSPAMSTTTVPTAASTQIQPLQAASVAPVTSGVAPKNPAPRATTKATATPNDSCDPPFYYDASGRKKYKRQCL